MKKLVLLLTVLAIMGCKNSYKEGDIVFQISKSRQSPLIQQATGSRWSHCGIVIEKEGNQYVLEASNVVKLTPLKQWIKKGKDSKIRKRRILSDPVKIKYKKYLSKPYDTAFRFNNNKWYCSELVYEIYKEQFNIELCKPRKVREYNIDGLERKMRKRGISPDQEVVAPDDLL